MAMPTTSDCRVVEELERVSLHQRHPKPLLLAASRREAWPAALHRMAGQADSLHRLLSITHQVLVLLSSAAGAADAAL